MTDEPETVNLGMMPTTILPDDVNVPTFFMAEMEKGSGKVRPSREGAEMVEESAERYAVVLSEHTELTHQQAQEQLGIE